MQEIFLLKRTCTKCVLCWQFCMHWYTYASVVRSVAQKTVAPCSRCSDPTETNWKAPRFNRSYHWIEGDPVVNDSTYSRRVIAGISPVAVQINQNDGFLRLYSRDPRGTSGHGSLDYWNHVHRKKAESVFALHQQICTDSKIITSNIRDATDEMV